MARYGRTLFDKRMMPASLDHAMWFHRPFRADEWLLYAQDSPSAQGGRGLTRGMIFKPDGTLVASVAQEGSLRERKLSARAPVIVRPRSTSANCDTNHCVIPAHHPRNRDDASAQPIANTIVRHSTSRPDAVEDDLAPRAARYCGRSIASRP